MQVKYGAIIMSSGGRAATTGGARPARRPRQSAADREVAQYTRAGNPAQRTGFTSTGRGRPATARMRASGLL
jgi:hypothetical protein